MTFKKSRNQKCPTVFYIIWHQLGFRPTNKKSFSVLHHIFFCHVTTVASLLAETKLVLGTEFGTPDIRVARRAHEEAKAIWRGLSNNHYCLIFI